MRVLVVTADPGAARPLKLPGFASTVVSPRGCLAVLQRESFDCVMLTPGEVSQDSARLHATIRDNLAGRAIPLVLAASPISAKLAKLVTDLRCGALVDLRWDPSLIAACLNMAILAMQQDETTLKAQSDILSAVAHEASRLKELSLTDDLTGLYNRRFLDELVAEDEASDSRFGRRYAVLVADLDDLKKINTRHGHSMGSAVLNSVGKLIARSLRKTDYGFRYGGDEFVIVSPSTAATEAKAMANRLRNAVAELDLNGENEGRRVTLSMGIALRPQHGKSFSQVFVEADQALFEAKAKGKNTVSLRVQA